MSGGHSLYREINKKEQTYFLSSANLGLFFVTTQVDRLKAEG
jgi:hypothetical protein